jgi:predicted heme/steroid binding protein
MSAHHVPLNSYGWEHGRAGGGSTQRGRDGTDLQQRAEPIAVLVTCLPIGGTLSRMLVLS